MAHNTIQEQKLNPAAKTNMILFAFIAIGILSFIFGLATNAERAWKAYLVNDLLFLGCGIGAVFFLVVHYLAGSGWFVAVRRIPEAMTSYLRIAFITTIALFFGLGKIYPWTNHELMREHELAHKAGYFSATFFAIRVVLFFIVILFFSAKLIGNSLRQDTAGGIELRNKQKPLSAGFLVAFAPLFTVFSVDVVKSLEPTWFSTMFGVYVFIGFVYAGTAAITIALILLKKAGYLSIVKPDHFHDMGKFMFGWVVFWAYIAFSQYMLIWYANLPEETSYFLHRQEGSWVYVGILLIIGKFILPFFMLLPFKVKRTLNYLLVVAIWMVLMEWVDLYWMIIPTASPNGIQISWMDIGMFLGFLGLFAFTVRRFLSRNPMVPLKDPFLHETLHHHVV